MAPRSSSSSSSSFALNPGTASDTVLKYQTSKDDRKIYEDGCKALSDDKFDCVEGDQNDLMTLLANKAAEFGWTSRIMLVKIDKVKEDGTVQKDGEEASMLTEHGRIPLEKIHDHDLAIAQKQTRATQDLYCMYKCLYSSLSKEGRTKVNVELSKFQHWDASKKEHLYLGNSLLKVILMTSSVDSKSGAFAIRMSLASLDQLIIEMKWNITTFNHQVKKLVMDLNRKGERSADLVFNLFRAYKLVPVTDFETFIDRMKDEADESPEKSKPNYIMDRAESKYKALVNERAWDTTREDKIVALEAKLARLVAASGGTKTGQKQSKKQKRGSVENKSNNKKKKKTVDITRKPKDIHKPVVINGANWYWCCPETGGKCTGQLRKHKPSECEGKAKDAVGGNKPSKPGIEAKVAELSDEVDIWQIHGKDSDME